MGQAISRLAHPDQNSQQKERQNFQRQERHGSTARNPIFDELFRRPSQYSHQTSTATQLIEVRDIFCDYNVIRCSYV